MTSLDTWHDEARVRVGAITDDDQVRALDAAWSDFAAQDRLVVAVYGPYSAGKTTLIRRLLLEDGTPVPDWLTVSAVQETDAVRTVDSGPLRFADSPGVRAGNAALSAAADRSLLTADALLVMLPVQLMTDGRGAFTDVVSGARFNPLRPLPFPDGALRLVIGKADEGLDPEYAPGEYRQWRDRKTAELIAQLDGGIVPDRVHAVIASPSGFDATADRLDDLRRLGDLDGIATLRAALQSLVPARAALREAARTRFWAAAASTAWDQAQARIADLRRTAAAVDAEIARYDQLLALLDGLRRAAEQQLRARLDALAAQLGEQRSGRGLLDAGDRFTRAVEEWSVQYTAELQALIDKAAADQRERATAVVWRESGQLVAEVLDRLEPGRATASPELLGTLAVRLRDASVKRMARTAQAAAQAATPAAPQAVTLIEQIQHQTWFRTDGTPVKSTTYLRKTVPTAPSTFKSLSTAAAKSAPALLAGASAALDAWLQHHERRREEERRFEIRDQLRAAADHVLRAVLDTPDTGWNAQIAAVQADFTNRRPTPAATWLATELTHLTTQSARLESLLRTPPA